MAKTTHLFTSEITLSLGLSFLALILIRLLQLDFYLADLIYAVDNAWTYRHSWLFSTVIHDYAKKLIIAMFVIFIIHTLYVAIINKNQHNLKAKIVLMAAMIAGTLAVSWLKMLIQADCPWDLIQYGGNKPYFEIFAYNVDYLPSSGCFPAAHASAGFCFLSIYFYCLKYAPRYKNLAFIGALTLGFVFGIAQQMRGAHFLSHTLWSLIVCIFVNVFIYAVAYGKFKTIEKFKFNFNFHHS